MLALALRARRRLLPQLGLGLGGEGKRQGRVACTRNQKSLLQLDVDVRCDAGAKGEHRVLILPLASGRGRCWRRSARLRRGGRSGAIRFCWGRGSCDGPNCWVSGEYGFFCQIQWKKSFGMEGESLFFD